MELSLGKGSASNGILFRVGGGDPPIEIHPLRGDMVYHGVGRGWRMVGGRIIPSLNPVLRLLYQGVVICEEVLHRCDHFLCALPPVSDQYWPHPTGPKSRMRRWSLYGALQMDNLVSMICQVYCKIQDLYACLHVGVLGTAFHSKVEIVSYLESLLEGWSGSRMHFPG